MKTIIEEAGKFAIKETDEAGNSMGVGAERFDTEAEAQAFIDGAEGEATAPHGAEGDQPEAPVEEKAPEDAPVDGEATGSGETAPANSDESNGAA